MTEEYLLNEILKIINRYDSERCPDCGTHLDKTGDAMNPLKCSKCHTFPSIEFNSYFNAIHKIASEEAGYDSDERP